MAAMGDGELSSLRLRTIGFVFQQFNLIPTLTAAQNVEVALAPAGQKAGERRETVLGLLESVGLGRARGSRAEQALRRRAAARGDREGARERTARPARRRADRQPRHGDGRRDPRPSHVALGRGRAL